MVPFIATAGEVKTKPTQHSVKELRSIGIQADILLCRADRNLSKDIKSKIALFCNVGEDAVITAKDVDCIYEVPLNFHKEGLDDKIVELLHIWTRAPRLENWEELIRKFKNPKHEVTIAIVGKYVDLTESYKSLNEALYHGGIPNDSRVNLMFIDSETLDPASCEACLVGRWHSGAGRIRPARNRRQDLRRQICQGEPDSVFRHLSGHADRGDRVCQKCCRIPDAHSSEFNEFTANPVIYLMLEWYDEQLQSFKKGMPDRTRAPPCGWVPIAAALNPTPWRKKPMD